MSFADQLTVARAVSVPIVVALFAISFPHHDYWATGVFCAAMATDWFDGRIARRTGRTSSFGSLLDPVADKLLVMATLIVLLDQDVFPAWMVAAIVARELLISGPAPGGGRARRRDRGPRPRQAEDVVAGDRGRASAVSRRPASWRDDVAWWALLVALVLTWVSGLDYARSAPRVLRGRAGRLALTRLPV